MNSKFILLIVLIIVGFSSCSTAYKIEQTPDDVYYSPVPQQNEYVQTYNEEDRNVYNNYPPEDREILRRVNNRRFRRHHYDYNDNVYGYTYPYGYYPYGYYPYGTYYPVYINPKTSGSASTYIAPRKYNLGTYTKPRVTTYTTDPGTGKITPAPATSASGTPVRTFSKPNTGSGVGNFIRRAINNPNQSYNNNRSNIGSENTSQSRSFEPSRSTSSSPSSSSSSSSRSSSSSSNSAPVRTFTK